MRELVPGGELVTQEFNGSVDRYSIHFVDSAPLGAAFLRRADEVSSNLGQLFQSGGDAVGLPLALSMLGSTRVEYRIPVLVTSREAETLLLYVPAESNLVLAIGHRRTNSVILVSAVNLASGEHEVLALCSRAQFEWVMSQRDSHAIGPFHLNHRMPNGQTLVTGRSTEESDLEAHYLSYPLPHWGTEALSNSSLFQTYPMNQVPTLGSRDIATMSVVMHPAMAKKFGRNRYVDVEYPNLPYQAKFSGSISLPVQYDVNIPPGRVVISERTLRALHLRNGEWVKLGSTRTRLRFTEHSKFLRDRKCIARVVGPEDVDLGRRVGRISKQLLAVLGLDENSILVVTSHVRKDSTVKRLVAVRPEPLVQLRLRALVQETSVEATLDSEVGADGTPTIALDLIRREQLGVQVGDPVLLRPAYGALFQQEILLLTNALTISAVGAFAATKVVVASFFIGLLLVVVAGNFIRRHR